MGQKLYSKKISTSMSNSSEDTTSEEDVRSPARENNDNGGVDLPLSVQQNLVRPSRFRLEHIRKVVETARTQLRANSEGGQTREAYELLQMLLDENISHRGSLWTACERFHQARSSPVGVPPPGGDWNLVNFFLRIADEALAFPDRFSGSCDDAMLLINAVQVSYSKKQALSILCCAFLCLFPRQSDNCRSAMLPINLPSINYDEMFLAKTESVETEKLLMFLDYLYEMIEVRGSAGFDPSSLPAACNSPIHILRHRSPDLASLLTERANDPMLLCSIAPAFASIDDQSDMLRVDFANEMIGGASIAYGCVQEEITFSLCPELNTARLIHTPMRDDEAIVLCGAEQFSTLKHGTYAFSMKHDGAVQQPTPRGGAILAIDAMDYRYHDVKMQYTRATIERELRKCLAAFSAPVEACGVPLEEASRIATGNWGCGVFGGDLELKFLIQWLACSLTKKQMVYFPFDKRYVHQQMGALIPRVVDAMPIRLMAEFLFGQVPNAVRKSRSPIRVWQLLTEFLQGIESK